MESHSAKHATTAPESSPTGLMVVIGDWVIDEYWLLVRHRSRISSHTGFRHYRIATDPDDEIVDLCGAGHVARILSYLNHNSCYDILGIGTWNKRDTSLIRHLLHARNNSACPGNSPGFTVTRETCEALENGIRLHTLAPEGPTARVVRQYHRQHDGVEQINRVDWETPGKNNPTMSIRSLPLPVVDPAYKVVIAVNDLNKGTVTAEVIADLAAIYPRAIWCVRSKVKNPPWLPKIRPDDLRLLVLGPEIAEKLNPWGSWITHRTISYQALDVLEDLPGINVALISGEREIVGRFGLAVDCVTAQSMSEFSPIDDLGFPTAVFAILTDRVFRNLAPALKENDLEISITTAEEVAGVPLAHVVREPIIKPANINVRRREDERRTWDESRTNMGILQRADGCHLDVWRACTALDGYVACVTRKEQIISEIGRALRAFRRNPPQSNHLSILIQADPGAGKTHLAKSLAAAFRFSFARFDITQMLHRDDLLELFDSVATRQANTQHDLLVFVDEVNASLDASPVYGAFLSPLEEGYYVRRGSSFSLRPCVWIFVGTGREDRRDRLEKLSDFESRMTMVQRIDYEGLKKDYGEASKRLEDEARLEQVYLGALMIRRHFPDVTRVSEAVLRQFYMLDPAKSPARGIRRMCAALKDVQYGMVSRRNCEDWGPRPWDSAGKKSFVQLNF